MSSQPHISVLMTCYNHVKYVGEQIDSILAQTWQNWDLTISDNGSTDGSWEILKRYEEENPDKIKVVKGPGGGCCANFMSLTANANTSADYYAWSDSDDIWLPKKLEMAMELVKSLDQQKPILYGSNNIPVDSENHELAPLDRAPQALRRPPNFGNAMEQCLATGMSMVFNRPSRELIVLGAEHGLAIHDWWAYMVVTGAGGQVIYDPRPTVRYRRHAHNYTNGTPRFSGRFGRIKAALCGRHRGYLERYLPALEAIKDHLTPENREKLADMITLHRGDVGPIERLRLVRKIGLHRQSVLQSIAVYVLALLRKL